MNMLALRAARCGCGCSAAAASLACHLRRYATTQLPLLPGGQVQVTCISPLVALVVVNKPGVEDAVTVEARQQPMPRMAGQQDQAGSSSSLAARFTAHLLAGGRIVDVVEGASEGTSASQQLRQPVSLSVSIPSRYTGLAVTTAGGSVSVAQLQEADVHISTSGGSVDVKRAKGASNASINTANAANLAAGLSGHHTSSSGSGSSSSRPRPGGSIEAGELSASRVSVTSGGGAVSLRRLFGLTVDVTSGGGPLRISTLYCEGASISAARPEQPDSSSSSEGVLGGPLLHINHMACLAGEARLHSGGGPLTVDGLEGNAVLLSDGGDVKVHVHEQARHVYVDSHGGCVEAWVSPSGAPLGLQVNAGGGISLDASLQVTGQVSPTSLLGVTGGISNAGAGGGARSTSSLVQRAVAGVQRSVGLGGGVGVPAEAEAAGSSAGDTALRQLIINAGTGACRIRAMGWMDGLRARLEAKELAQQQRQ